MKTVLIGAPLAGKATCLRALARALGGTLQPRKLVCADHPFGFERGVGFALPTARSEGEFWTINGTPFLSDAWHELLLESQNVVLVLDAHPVRAAQNAEAVALLRCQKIHPARGRVVLTKADLLGEAEAYRQRDLLLRGTDQAAWPTFVHTLATSDDARVRDLVPKAR